MKELLLQIAGVKTEAEFYKKFPTQEAFFKAYPEAQEIIAQYQQQEMMANAPKNSEEQMMGTQEEMVEQMASGGNVPTNPSLWSKAKAAAKAKYDVYPCVPMDSQALTKEGWKHYNELSVGEDILAYNQETNKNEWTPILTLQFFNDAPLIRLFKKQTNFDIKCTPNHKWVLAESNSKYPDNLVEAKDITKHMSIKISAELTDNGNGLSLNTFFKKDNWVKNILKMSISQIQSFFASGIVYDGHDKGLTKKEDKQTYGFSQKEKDHGLAMEIAAVLLGYRVCSVVKKHNPTIMSWTFIRRNTESTQNLHKEDAGISDVWCPTTKFGTWVMKQNGYVTITGNSAYANGFAAKWYKEKGGSWKKAAMGGYINEYAEGGGIDNVGFKALPKSVQNNIIANMAIKGRAFPFNPTLDVNTSVEPRFGEDFVRGNINPMYYDKNFSFGPYFGGYVSLDGAKIDDFGLTGSYNLNDRLSINADLNPNAINAGMRLNFANGGGINNPGFKALPKSVQDNIIANMAMGGMVDEYGNGGYTVRKSNDRKGKTHVVTGPDGTKKYFGDPNMGERSKSKYGKEAFYARHKTNLKNNPYFRAYARSTWADGGIIPEMEELMLAGDYYNMGGYVEYPTQYFLGGLLDAPKGAPQDFQNNSMYPMNYPGGGMIAGPMMGYEDNDFMYAMGGGININPANKGKFTEWAASRGMGVQEAANKVMANKDKYPTNVVQMANFARNAAKWKKQDGGEIDALDTLYNRMPVQTESYQGQPEQVVLPDGTIQSVKATQSHESMSDNEITDVLPTGSHIQSSRNKYTPAQYQQLIDMFTPEVAKERMIQIEQITKGKNKKISPAEISEYAKNKYQKQSTPNSFNTDKLKESNKQSFVDLSMQMNDLIKAGKELAEGQMQLPMENPMMAYGGMVNKYQDGTDSNVGIDRNLYPAEAGYTFDDVNDTVTWTNPIANTYKYLTDNNILKYNPNLGNEVINGRKVGKLQVNFPQNMAYEEYLPLAQAVEQMDLANVRQSKTPGYKTYFGGNNPFFDARYFVEKTRGKTYDKNVSKETVFKDYFTELGIEPTAELIKNAEKILDSPEGEKIYNAYLKKTPGMRPNPYNISTLGDTPKLKGIQQLKAVPPKQQPAKVNTPQTPAEKAANLELARINAVAGARQMPMQNRFNYGLLEGQLGRGLAANEAYTNALMDLDPLYIMETPDTYIRSRKNEIPIGNILYNIERAQRNSANALAGQTGDWSTLASNIANAGATAMNQVGNTLSALNEKNVGLYNTTQGLQQGLLGENIDVRNENLTAAQNLANLKRNLLGKKAVTDSELYSQYVKSMGENTQKEQNQKLQLLNIMAAKPDMFRGEQGQRFANQIMGNTGSFNNAFAGSPLDFLFNNISR